MVSSLYRVAAATLAASALSVATATSATAYGPDYYQPTLKFFADNSSSSALTAIAYPIATGYLSNISGIPDQTFSASGIDLTLTNIQVVNFSLPQQYFNISFQQPNIITVNASHVSVTADADYTAKASVLSALSGTAQATLSNLVISAAAALGTDGRGHPTLQVLNTGLTIGSVAVSLGGDSSGLLNSLLPIAESQITSTLQSTLNTQVQAIVNNTLSPLVASLPLTYPLYFVSNNTEAYYGLVDETNPQTNTSAIYFTPSVARIASAAQIQPIQYTGIPATSIAHHAIPDSRPSYGMLNQTYPELAVAIDEYFVNYALYTLAVNNVSYTISQKSLPSTYSSYLSTSTLSFIYPTLASQYPNSPLIAKVRPAVVSTGSGYAFPTLTVNHTGNHSVYAPLHVDLAVNHSGVITQLATVLVTVNATIEFALQPFNGTQKIVGNATSLNLGVETISQQYDFNPPLSSFGTLANQLAGGSLLNAVNGVAAMGYALPKLPYAQLQNATFQSIDHVLYLLTNVVAQ